MDTVLVGLDVPSADARPLRWAVDYSHAVGAELVGVVGYQLTEAEVPPDWYDTKEHDVRKRAELAMDAAAPTVPHRVDLRYGDPRHVIADVASDDKATAVVVGAHGDGGFHHLGIGTVAHHLAHHLPMPLVSVPSSGPALQGGTIVAGLDGSPGDVSTLEWAARLAQASDGRVLAVYASDPMASSYPHPQGATAADAAAALVEAQVANAVQRGLDATAIVEVDHPVAAITRVADEHDAALVVVGRKGAGHLRGLLLGRVPAELPFEAHRAVAIVPRASAD